MEDPNPLDVNPYLKHKGKHETDFGLAFMGNVIMYLTDGALHGGKRSLELSSCVTYSLFEFYLP